MSPYYRSTATRPGEIARRVVLTQMVKIQRFLLVLQFVFLAVSANAGAQSAAAPSYAMPSNRLSSWQRQQRGQFGIASRGKAAATNRPVKAGANAQGASQLCFLPGVGWQTVPKTTVGDTTKITESRSAGLRGTKQSTLVARPVNQSPSGADRNRNSTCSGSFSNVTASEVLNENYGTTMSANSPTEISSSTQNGLQAKSAFNVLDNSIPRWRATGSSSIITRGKRTVSNPSSELMGGAHLSPIELRREIRNAHDLTTRIKLRRLQLDESRASGANRTGRHIGTKHSNGFFERRANTPSLSGVRAHAKRSTKVRSPRAN